MLAISSLLGSSPRQSVAGAENVDLALTFLHFEPEFFTFVMWRSQLHTFWLKSQSLFEFWYLDIDLHFVGLDGVLVGKIDLRC